MGTGGDETAFSDRTLQPASLVRQLHCPKRPSAVRALPMLQPYAAVLWLCTPICCFWWDSPLRGVFYITVATLSAAAVEETTQSTTRAVWSGRRPRQQLLSRSLLNTGGGGPSPPAACSEFILQNKWTNNSPSVPHAVWERDNMRIAHTSVSAASLSATYQGWWPYIWTSILIWYEIQIFFLNISVVLLDFQP